MQLSNVIPLRRVTYHNAQYKSSCVLQSVCVRLALTEQAEVGSQSAAKGEREVAVLCSQCMPHLGPHPLRLQDARSWASFKDLSQAKKVQASICYSYDLHNASILLIKAVQILSLAHDRR